MIILCQHIQSNTMKMVKCVRVLLRRNVFDRHWATEFWREKFQVRHVVWDNYCCIEWYCFVHLLGIAVGCLPIYSLRQSTLECFYNFTCLQELADFASTTIVFEPLNVPMNSRFLPVSSVPIGTLIDELFLETWQTTNNYSAYFTSCAPALCQYTHAEKNTIIYIVTTRLGLYGGLTIGVKLFVWHLLSVYWRFQLWLFHRQSRVTPVSIDWWGFHLIQINILCQLNNRFLYYSVCET